jgi:hypothetical protein
MLVQTLFELSVAFGFITWAVVNIRFVNQWVWPIPLRIGDFGW